MNCIAKLVVGLIVAAPLGLGATPTLAKTGCVLAGGEATMITEDLARFMANAALGNSIKGMGAASSGAIKMICTPAAFSTHCIARQRACKG